MDNIKAIIAANLIKLRKQNKLTQLELAERINYSDKAVSRWENGEVVPDVETLNKLCEIYNIPIAKLFDLEMDVEFTPKQEKQNKRNQIIIALLGVSCVWFMAISLHITLMLSFGINLWKAYIYAVPITFVVAIVFNSLWGKRGLNFVFISCLAWSALTSCFVLFLKYNMWPLFILGAPIQVAIILWSQLKPSKKS